MKKFLYSILSIFLLFTLLISTVTINTGAHYCKGNLVEISLFSKIKGCGMEKQPLSTDSACLSKKNCCSNTSISGKAQSELLSEVNPDILNKIVISTFIYCICSELIMVRSTYREYYIKHFSPPQQLIYKITESYLI